MSALGRDPITGLTRPQHADIASLTVRPNEIDLFMFSAATRLTHRIHYDRDYAKSEGHANLLVHGPLQGAYLSQMLADYADGHDGRLITIDYRHHQPAYCGDTLTCSAHPTSLIREADSFTLAVRLRIVNGQGETVTSGSATLRLHDDRGLAGVVEAAERSQ
jgi:hydroxyacyl-ACP dehydratase HTD2-like protein with hotdog domain